MSLIKYILIAIIFTFIGYENPSLTELPKKYVKFYLKKLKISETFVVENKQIDTTEQNKDLNNSNNIESIEGNSFNLEYKKILNFDDRTASFYVKDGDKKKLFEVYLQEGIKISGEKVSEINLPLNFTLKKNGGVKSVFKKNGLNFALVSSKKNIDCYHASLINLENSKKVFETDCLPDYENVDFNGLGGGYINYSDDLILTLGAPEWNSSKIRNLAQDEKSFYGKSILIKNEIFTNDNSIIPDNKNIKIFTKGHKNHQGITLSNNIIFSVEHGPQGGDELNILKKGNNYGWPLVSYGTLYNDGKSFLKLKKDTTNPIYTFLPSIAPSAINNCPDNLKNYYKENHCLVMLSLRGMSIFVLLIDKKNFRLISLEKFLVDQRLRHFGLNYQNRMYQKNNFFYISVDGEGLYEMKFNNFR